MEWDSSTESDSHVNQILLSSCKTNQTIPQYPSSNDILIMILFCLFWLLLQLHFYLWQMPHNKVIPTMVRVSKQFQTVCVNAPLLVRCEYIIFYFRNIKRSCNGLCFLWIMIIIIIKRYLQCWRIWWHMVSDTLRLSAAFLWQLGVLIFSLFDFPYLNTEY